MEEDGLDPEPILAHQEPAFNAGMAHIKDLSSGGLPPRGPHLCFSLAQRRKLPLIGVSSRKMNALPFKKSPMKSLMNKVGHASSSNLPGLPPSSGPIAETLVTGPNSGPAHNGPLPLSGPALTESDQTYIPRNEEPHTTSAKSTRPPTVSATATIPEKGKI